MDEKKRGRPRTPLPAKAVMDAIVPKDDIFDPQEREMYEKFFSAYLRDFDESQLTVSDMDDIMSIAMARVQEFRLMKSSKSSDAKQVDVSSAIEKLRKQTDKLKENLASRRKDRIDPKKYTGFSIVDLAAAFDSGRKDALFHKAEELLMEEDKLRKNSMLIGNSNDIDSSVEFEVEDE